METERRMNDILIICKRQNSPESGQSGRSGTEGREREQNKRETSNYYYRNEVGGNAANK